jgi:hypothetical protein
MSYEKQNAVEVLSSIIELSILTFNHSSGGQVNLSSKSARHDLSKIIASSILVELTKMTSLNVNVKKEDPVKPPMQATGAETSTRGRWMPPNSAIEKYKKIQEDTDKNSE